MDLIRNSSDGLPLVRAYGGGGFRIGALRHEGSVLVSRAGVQIVALSSVGGIGPAIVSDIVAIDSRPDILIVGTGATMMFLDTAVRESLRAAGIAVDCMATGPACRTFNVALGEGRRVAALLIAVP